MLRFNIVEYKRELDSGFEGLQMALNELVETCYMIDNQSLNKKEKLGLDYDNSIVRFNQNSIHNFYQILLKPIGYHN